LPSVGCRRGVVVMGSLRGGAGGGWGRLGAGGKVRRAAVRAMGRCALAPRPPQDNGRFATLTGIFSETGVSRGVSGGDPFVMD